MKEYKKEFDTMPTMKLNELKEAERIKISLLKYIYKSTKGRYIAVPEVSLPNSVIDILVTNGDIHIYEIKSKADSLVRLEKQINDYKKFAHKVTVVADEKFISKLDTLDFMDGVGVISVSSRYGLTHIRDSKKFEVGKNFYLAYWSPIELRESLRGFEQWYKYSSDEAYNKILDILTEDELRKVTLFRLKEKYIREHLKRQDYIENKDYEKALLSRFKDLEDMGITPLKYLPAHIFKDFD
ncbi:sce7726 family protein [Aliarcobacter butzleri]